MKNAVRFCMIMVVLLGVSGVGLAGETPALKNQTVKGPIPAPHNIPFAIPDLKCVAYALWNNGSKDIKINNGDKFSTTSGTLAGIIIKYFVSAENLGTKTKAQNFVLKATVTKDGAVVQQRSWTIGSLEAGKGVKFSFDIPTLTDQNYHQYKLVAVVDPTNVVQETNENNNTFTLDFAAQVQFTN